MFPASAVRWPPARSRWASNAVVVLLPLVPVTHTVWATTPSLPARSPNHSAVPPMKRVPRAIAALAASPYGLMPGDFTTTSKPPSCSALASVMTWRCVSPRPRASSASVPLQNSVRGRSGRRLRIARWAARPSRPHPHSATRCPSSCEMRTQAFPERGGNALLVIDPQQRFDPQVAVAQLRTDLADEPLDQCVLAPFRASGERGHGRT